MGSGALVMANTAIVYNDNPDFTGRIVIQRGNFQVSSPFKWGFDNASEIVIGITNNADMGGPALAFRPDGDGVPSTYNVPQNIKVVGYSATPRLTYSYSSTHDDAVNILGQVDLTEFVSDGANRVFLLAFNEGNLRTRDAYNGDSLRDDAYMSLLGEIAGGNKPIRSYLGDAGGTLDVGQVRTPEMGYNWIVTLAGTNTGWTGSLEVGNRQGTAADQGLDNDKNHVMRFGLDQGLPTWGIGSNNIVILRHNATLQAYGSQATIGTLIPDATEAVDGFYGNTPVTNTWLENGGFNPGTLTIVQASNKVFSGGIRNGEIYSRFMTNSPAAALSIVKAGPASLTLIQSNTYSGTTRIMAGTLALTGTAAIAQSSTIQIDSGAFLNVTGLTAGAMTLASGQTLKGQGTFVGGLIVGSGATVAPGTSPGVLTAQNNVTLSSGSTFEVELLGTLAGEADQLLMAGATDTLTLGGATLSVLAPNLLPYLSSFVIIDGFNSLDSSRFAGLPNSGDTLTGGVNQFEIQYNANDVTLTVIPEPASLGLMGLMGIAGWLLRRRRR
jgi:autotransporter-associated beta strand protein